MSDLFLMRFYLKWKKPNAWKIVYQIKSGLIEQKREAVDFKTSQHTKPKIAEHPRFSSCFCTVHSTWDTVTNIMREPIITTFLLLHDNMTVQNLTLGNSFRILVIPGVTNQESIFKKRYRILSATKQNAFL